MAKQQNENSLKNLKPPWKPGQSGNPQGGSAKVRKERRQKDEIEKHMVSLFGTRRANQLMKGTLNSQLVDTIAQRATISELQRIAKDPESSAYEVSIAMSIILDAKNGKTTTIDKIAERLHGKPTQRMEITGKDGANFMPARVLTKEEAGELIKNMEDKY